MAGLRTGHVAVGAQSDLIHMHRLVIAEAPPTVQLGGYGTVAAAQRIREHPLDARSLATPVLVVGAAAVLFLHAVPAGGSDLALEAAGVLAGAAMGAIGGLATRLRLGADGRPLGRAGVLAASMWIGGVGARLAFAIAAGNGTGPAIARFSVAHHITGSSAWIAALVLMALADVLTRLAIIYLRGRRLAAGPAAAAAAVPVGASA